MAGGAAPALMVSRSIAIRPKPYRSARIGSGAGAGGRAAAME